MADLLGIGIAGLRVSQTSLQVTGNNISNANVESYTRQRTIVSTGPEQQRGPGFIGSGSIVSSIDRVLNEFTLSQIRADNATFNEFRAFGDNIEQLDSLLAGELSSLSPGIASLFESLETAIEDPTSTPARQLVISEAGGLIERFQTIYDRLIQQSVSVNDQLNALSQQVSSLSIGIAELNDSISRTQNQSLNGQPNGLLDERDELLRQLSEIVAISTVEEDTGAVSVFIGNGQPLVVGTNASTLTTQPNALDSDRRDIAFVGINGLAVPITESIRGGELGGLLQFQEDALEPALNEIGRIALALTDSLNQQNKQGLDLEGNFGSVIFQDINNTILVGSRSQTITGTATLGVVIQDLGELTADNYSLTVTAAGPPVLASLTNERTGQVIPGSFVATDLDGNAATPDVDVFVPTNPAETQGLAVFVDSGALAVNDRFFLQPTRNGAADVELQIDRPQELAFASPVIAQSSLNNTGGGTISSGTVLEAFDRNGNPSPAFATPNQLTPPIAITFTTATAYEVRDTSTVPSTLLFNGTFTPGQSNVVFSEDPTVLQPPVLPSAAPFFLGYQVELGGSPGVGDTFTIDYNGSGISDNRNGVALGQLRINGTLENSTLNFEDAYGRLIEDIGAETAQNRISRESSFALLQSSTNERAAVSGVNLDEEAANLIRFEQAYNASAQLISVARQIFDTLLNSF